MEFFVYILFSKSKNRFYVGQTENVEKRLQSHQSKISPYTSTANDWQLMYTETFEARTEAIRRENQIKKMKSRTYIEELIKKQNRD